MRVENKIHLNKFTPRKYQYDLCQAIEEGKFKKIMAIWPRRAGKDWCVFNMILRMALRRVGVYMYCLPTFRQAKLVIWDSISNDGTRFLDCIPKDLIVSKNGSELKITLSNGSIIQLIGSDSYNTSLVGTNPRCVVMSEYALADRNALAYIRPILNANDGTLIVVSTPRGHNSLWELYNIAIESDDWFVSRLTLEDTQHISWTQIQKEIESGEISYDLAMQEYFCNFDLQAEGSYYSKYIDKMRLDGRITTVPYEPQFLVNTAWDLGVRDSTCIIWYQQVGPTIRVIDYYTNNKQGLEHYVDILRNKPYRYDKHFAPHDIAVQEFGTGLTRLEMANNLGVKFEVVTDRHGRQKSALPMLSLQDGIEAVRATFAKMWIDETKCADLIRDLENYRQEFDHKRQVYLPRPLHDRHSHGSDGMRYLCLSLSRMGPSTTPEELERRYQQSRRTTNFAAPFNNPPF